MSTIFLDVLLSSLAFAKTSSTKRMVNRETCGLKKIFKPVNLANLL